MAVVAVAHRLCRILYSMLKNRTNFDVGKLGVEKGPFRRTPSTCPRNARFYGAHKATVKPDRVV
jgi:hypothetical protein